jgi:hypothetical protein
MEPRRNFHWTFLLKRNVHLMFSLLPHFLLVTIGFKVIELYVHPKNKHLYPKIGAKNVTMWHLISL